MNPPDGFTSAVKLHIRIQQLRQRVKKRRKVTPPREITPPAAIDPLEKSTMMDLLSSFDRSFAKEANATKAASFWRKVDPSKVRAMSDCHFPQCQCLKICGESPDSQPPPPRHILHPDHNPYEKVYEDTSLPASGAKESNLLGAYRQSIEATSSSRT